MKKCRYYTEQLTKGEGDLISLNGRCYGMKYAPSVSCGGDETKCEMCKRRDEMQYDLNYDLVSENVFQIKITERDNTVEKVYCKSCEDANAFINSVMAKRDLTRVKLIQIMPIKNLYYRKR